jgi:hypothetical protein
MSSVRQVAQQAAGRQRACYETGLSTNPALGGQVTVKLVIGPDGALTAAEDGGSDLPDRSVVQCVVRTFSGLSFPRPDGGSATILYPLSFHPSR